jgi:HKD family nuclease
MLHQIDLGASIFANHKNFGGDFGKEISKNLESFQSLEIASGYFGASLIDVIKPKLLQIAERGHCKILIGMIFNEGVSTSQKKKLEELHADLKKINHQSGVFVTLSQYHGKIYKFNNPTNSKIYVGSSNLSFSGFKDNYEFNALISDQQTKNRVALFLEHIFSPECEFSAELDEVELFVKGAKNQPKEVEDSSLRSFLISPSDFPVLPIIDETKIQLRVDSQPNSSLNLFFEPGRKNKNGKYAPRHWFEVEITSTAKEINQTGYPIGDFNAYIKDGQNHYLIPMITASANNKALTSKGDRKILGEFLKSKLQSLGILEKGQRITSDVLADYGKDFVVLKKFADGKYYFEF